MAKEITMEIVPNFDYIIEEQARSSTNLRKVGWNGKEPKLDIRKWSCEEAGVDRPLKGIGLTEDGANELASVLVELGYGDTERIKKSISARKSTKKINTTAKSKKKSNDNEFGVGELLDKE